jgi:hypothetical protein
MLHVLVSVRGYKTVVRFFPHEAADLERVLLVSSGPCDGIWRCRALQTSVLEATTSLHPVSATAVRTDCDSWNRLCDSWNRRCCFVNVKCIC